jgi:hypothetical protein
MKEVWRCAVAFCTAIYKTTISSQQRLCDFLTLHTLNNFFFLPHCFTKKVRPCWFYRILSGINQIYLKWVGWSKTKLRRLTGGSEGFLQRLIKYFVMTHQFFSPLKNDLYFQNK